MKPTILHFILSALLLWTGLPVHAQTDSLRKTLQSSLSDTQRVEVLHELAFLYGGSNADSAMYFAQAARLLTDSTDNTDWHITTANRLGYAWEQKAQLDSAQKYYLQALQLEETRDYPRGLARSHLYLGIIAKKKGALEEATKYYNAALRQYQQAGYPKKAAMAHLNLGNLYVVQQQYDSAQAHYQQSIALKEKHGGSLAISYKEYAWVLDHNGLHAEAATMYRKAIPLLRQTGQDNALADLYIAISNRQMQQGDYDSARTLLQTAEALKQRGNLQDDLATLYTYWGNFHFKHKHYDSARQAFTQAMAFAQRQNSPNDLLYACNGLGLVAWQQDSLPQARRYFEQGLAAVASPSQVNPAILRNLLYVCLRLGDNKAALSISKNLQALQKEREGSLARFHAATNALEISRYEQELATEALLRQQVESRNQLYLSALISLLILLGLGFLLLRLRRAKQKNILLKKEAEINQLSREQEERYQLGLLEGEQKERERLAHELHDDMGAKLAMARMHVQALEPHKAKLPHTVQDEYKQALSLIELSIDKARNIARDMDAGLVEDLGLRAGLVDLTQRMSGASSTLFELIISGRERDFSRVFERKLYLTCSELISNILKYADAARATLQVFYRENELMLMMEDDGKGFDPEEARQKGGMGLTSIHKRIEGLGGSISIDSKPGNGTITTLQIPYPQPEKS